MGCGWALDSLGWSGACRARKYKYLKIGIQDPRTRLIAGTHAQIISSSAVTIRGFWTRIKIPLELLKTDYRAHRLINWLQIRRLRHAESQKYSSK